MDHSDIPAKAVTAPVVTPSEDAQWSDLGPATAAALDAIEVDLRGGFTLSGEAIIDDPAEYADIQFVRLADIPAIIRAWASAALPYLHAPDDETTEAVAAELSGIAADLYRRSDNVPMSGDGRGVERVGTLREIADRLTSRAASLRGEQK